MVQIVEQTDAEKTAMYMKLPKKKLVAMLIEANKHLKISKVIFLREK